MEFDKEYLLGSLHKWQYSYVNNTIGILIHISYRWPMMIFIPRYFKEHLPTNLVNNHPAIHKIMAGATIAIFESIITCPFERVKC